MKRNAPVPVVTLLIILACLGAAFFVQFNPEMVATLGFRSQVPSALAAVASIFVHASWFHLLGNMVFLAAVGPAVEFGAGSARFLGVFLAGGLGGVLAFWLLAGNRVDAPLIGASGAIAACAAYYSVRYMNLRVPIAPGLGVPVLAITGIWLVLQIIGALTLSNVPGVAYWAHLGGFLVGLAASAFLGAPKLADMELGHEVLDRLNHRGPAARLAAAEDQLRRHRQDMKALLAKAEAHSDLGDAKEEEATRLQLVDLLSEAEQPTQWKRLATLGALNKVPSLRRVLAADRCASTDPEVAQSLLESVANGPQDDPQRPDALVALVALVREAKPNQASVWLRELEETYPLHPACELAKSRGWSA